MRSFRRTLGYLRPYRLRVAAILACALAIGALWGGGLVVVLPGAKVLLSEEGFHGWAYRLAGGDALGAKLALRGDPAGGPTVEVLSVEAGGPAEAGGIRAGDRLIGSPGGEAIESELAHLAAGGRMELTVTDRAGGAQRRAAVTPRAVSTSHELLVRLADALPRPSDPMGRLPLLLILLATAAVVTVARNVLRAAHDYLVATTVAREIVDIRTDVYNTVLRMPVTYFSRHGTAGSLSRFLQDAGEVAVGHVTLLGNALLEPLKGLAALAVAMALNWRLTLLVVLVGPPTAWLIRRFGKALHRASRRAFDAWSDMLAVLQETLGAVRVVKAYTLESVERRRFLRVNRRLLDEIRQVARIEATVAPAVETLTILATLAAVGVAGAIILRGGASTDREAFLTLLVSLAATFGPVRRVAYVATKFQRADAASRRLLELLDLPREPRRSAPPLPRHERSIELRRVSYRYDEAADWALSDVSLTIPFGQTVAVVGPNGAGKSTLVSLLLRLMDPAEGAVLVDGRDAAAHSIRSLRRQVAIVPQETVLFQASIAENIACGRPGADRRDVLEAGRRAFVDEFAGELPEGYDTVVGPRGGTLSGGQAQRVAIARAILRDPAILIFDEALSQVDGASEDRIRRAMAEFVRGRTTLIVAHRLATVRMAERIVVMDRGRIVADGSHEDLLRRCPLYRRLYETQFVVATDDERPEDSPAVRG